MNYLENHPIKLYSNGAQWSVIPFCSDCEAAWSSEKIPLVPNASSKGVGENGLLKIIGCQKHRDDLLRIYEIGLMELMERGIEKDE